MAWIRTRRPLVAALFGRLSEIVCAVSWLACEIWAILGLSGEVGDGGYELRGDRVEPTSRVSGWIEVDHELGDAFATRKQEADGLIRGEAVLLLFSGGRKVVEIGVELGVIPENDDGWEIFDLHSDFLGLPDWLGAL